jgi:hypothetical protein
VFALAGKHPELQQRIKEKGVFKKKHLHAATMNYSYW